MIYALNENNDRVCAKHTNKKGLYYCPLCGKQVIPKQLNDKVRQFYHTEPCNDNWKYDMSEYHYHSLMRYKKKNCEVYINNGTETHRADICIDDTVILFFHAQLSTEISQRTDFFINAGYRVILLFDMIEAYRTGEIKAKQTGDMYVSEYIPNNISSIIPQKQNKVAVLFQLTENKIVKVDWAKTTDGTHADYSLFYTDSYYNPDILTVSGIKTVFLNKKERFEAFLEYNKPYILKVYSSRKGYSLESYICPIGSEEETDANTKNWHNNKCTKCAYNLITEYRHKDKEIFDSFNYCCFPRIVSRVNPDTGEAMVLKINTKK